MDVIHRHLSIHGTIGTRKSHKGGSKRDVPSYVVNHGVLKFTELQALLKVCVCVYVYVRACVYV